MGSSVPKVVAEETHEGFLIQATPINEGGQFRLCGIISKEVGGEHREHKLIRADLFMSTDDAAAGLMRKARQVIKEQGEQLFDT